MKKPTVDYSGFRLRRINEPRFSHLKLLLSWLGYFLMYVLTEHLIPPEKCRIMHSPLDDLIPFREEFLIAYCFWYALIVISLLYFLFYDVDSFKKLQVFLIITQVVAMAIYIIYPTRQVLRPEVFERDNFLTHLTALIYTADTDTGVCPSLHVAYSLGIASVWVKYKGASWVWKTFIVVTAIMICLSTMFVKQHSAIDVFGAIALSLLAESLVFYVIYPKKKEKKE